ncbi:MAG: hypothetical protein AAGA81_00020 [Acidobacteriota bacterium]
METVKLDYAAKGVQFFYIYKPLAHPELENYISPFTLEERLMHVAEAKRRLGSSIPWLADTMRNDYHETVGRTPNSEFVLDSEAKVVARRIWSSPKSLREDLAGLVGAVEPATEVESLDLPQQEAIPTVAKGIVPRVPLPTGAFPLEIEPQVSDSKVPFYAKLRAEGTPGVFEGGKGTVYLGFHLDPLYKVHWNNEVDPVSFSIQAPAGVTVTPDRGVAIDPEEPADADPREFLVEVDGAQGDVLDVNVRYFACDDALTFCIPVQQDYKVHLERDWNHDWSIRTEADGSWNLSVPGGPPKDSEEAEEG